MLAMTGVLFGALTILAWIHGYEGRIAILFLLGIGKFAAFFDRAKPVLTAFIAGFIAAVLAVVTQMIFADIYFANNPEYLEVEVPFGLSPVAYTLIFAPLGGLVAGVVSVISAMIVTWVLKRAIIREIS